MWKKKGVLQASLLHLDEHPLSPETRQTEVDDLYTVFLCEWQQSWRVHVGFSASRWRPDQVYPPAAAGVAVGEVDSDFSVHDVDTLRQEQGGLKRVLRSHRAKFFAFLNVLERTDNKNSSVSLTSGCVGIELVSKGWVLQMCVS